jgi:hypothetical protein
MFGGLIGRAKIEIHNRGNCPNYTWKRLFYSGLKFISELLLVLVLLTMIVL